MAELSRITDGMAAEDAANLIYDNDLLNQEAVKDAKESFGDTINSLSEVYLGIEDTAASAYFAATAYRADFATEADEAKMAYKLVTPRKIFGQYFDGTADVTGDITIDGDLIPTTSLNSIGYFGKEWHDGFFKYLEVTGWLDVYEVTVGNHMQVMGWVTTNYIRANDEAIDIHGECAFGGTISIAPRWSKEIGTYMDSYGNAQFAGQIDAESIFTKEIEVWGKVSAEYFDGNAKSATRLDIPRTIWGSSFDGTEDISGDLCSRGSVSTGGKTVYNDGVTGVILHDTGTIRMAASLNGNIYGHYDKSTSYTHRITYTMDSEGYSWKFLGNVTSFGDGGYNLGDAECYWNKLYINDILAKGTITAVTISGEVSGNATTATSLRTSRQITIGNTGKPFDGSTDVSWTLEEIGAGSGGGSSTAESADRLTTPRTIWGQSFDGTANVSGDMSNVGRIMFSSGGQIGMTDSVWIKSLNYKPFQVSYPNAPFGANSFNIGFSTMSNTTAGFEATGGNYSLGFGASADGFGYVWYGMQGGTSSTGKEHLIIIDDTEIEILNSLRVKGITYLNSLTVSGISNFNSLIVNGSLSAGGLDIVGEINAIKSHIGI